MLHAPIGSNRNRRRRRKRGKKEEKVLKVQILDVLADYLCGTLTLFK
jgi:hypothetical protein